MKAKTKTPTTKKAATTPSHSAVIMQNAEMQTAQDLKSALLLVSLIINTFILIGWVTLQVTSQYDVEVATMLFVR